MILLYIYFIISFIIFIFCVLTESPDTLEEILTVVFLWPILLLKELLKALFKLLFTDWK
jgi:hypothetical protein